MTHILAADIGGTHTRLCIAHCERGAARIVSERTYASAAYSRFADVLREFLSGAAGNTIAAVCFAVAGPIRETLAGQTVKVTNLPWEIGAAALEREFGFPKVRLINDFQAIGYGIEALKEPDFTVLQMGNPVPHGPRAVIGAGTGLGQAILVWQRDHYEPVATEGGHADFGPTDELQIELARHLIKGCGRASYELILSGPGLARLYAFLRVRGSTPESRTLAEAIVAGDPAAAITQAALGTTTRSRIRCSICSSASTAPRPATSLSAPAPPAAFTSPAASHRRLLPNSRMVRFSKPSAARAICRPTWWIFRYASW